MFCYINRNYVVSKVGSEQENKIHTQAQARCLETHRKWSPFIRSYQLSYLALLNLDQDEILSDTIEQHNQEIVEGTERCIRCEDAGRPMFNTVIRTRQVRSADEPMQEIVVCRTCGNMRIFGDEDDSFYACEPAPKKTKILI